MLTEHVGYYLRIITWRLRIDTPIAEGDCYCETAVHDGANWHSAKTGWINVAG